VLGATRRADAFGAGFGPALAVAAAFSLIGAACAALLPRRTALAGGPGTESIATATGTATGVTTTPGLTPTTAEVAAEVAA